MKIKTIEVTNLKAVSNQTADFDGCSAIITAGNNKGKTTMLRGLIDRFHSQKPEIILKEGEEKGIYTMHLTDGSRIEWKFTEKSESFAFITNTGIKMTTGVLKAIGEMYFGIDFDIDKFLSSSPKEQSKKLALLVGLDFSEVDNRYKEAYSDRSNKNAVLKEISAAKKEMPDQVEKPDIEILKKEFTGIMVKNSKLRENWKTENEKHQNEINLFNRTQDRIKTARKNIELSYDLFLGYKDSYWAKCIDFDKAKQIKDSVEKEQERKPITTLIEPKYLSEVEVQQKIEQANEQQRLFDAYERNLSDYNKWVADGKKARENAQKADGKVKAIHSEKLKMISTANIPDEFKFTDDGILYNGLPLSNNQISSSAKYIAALKLGAMALGEVKTLHFDASFLDKNSLSEVEKWANENDLQLLIERPDFDGGEIKYKII